MRPRSSQLNRYGLSMLAVLVLLVSAPAFAQNRMRSAMGERVRPAFDAALSKDKPISGTIALNITGKTDGLQRFRATIGDHGWVVVVRLDDQTIGTVNSLPFRLGCDTHTVPDGVHTLTLSLSNTETDQELITDSAQVTVDNATADANAAAAALNVPPPNSSAMGAGPQGRAYNGGPISAAARTRPIPVVPAQAWLTSLTPHITASRDPLLASASLIVRSGNHVYLALSDGGIAWCAADTARKGGTVVRLAHPEGTARSLVTGENRVWWVSSDGARIYSFMESGHSVASYDVSSPKPAADTGGTSGMPPNFPAPPSGWVRGIALFRGQPLLLGDGGVARLLDAKTSLLTDPLVHGSAALPADALPSPNNFGDTRLRLISAGVGLDARTLLVSLDSSAGGPRPPGGRNRLRLWLAGADGVWKAIGDSGTRVDPSQEKLMDATAFGAATLENDGIRLLLTDASGQPAPALDVPFAHGPGMPWGADRIALGGSGVWWTSRGTVFHLNPFTGARDAYLPWNEPSMGPIQALTADRDGLWVATTAKGVRRIEIGKPTSRDGYGGFIHARLGDDSAQPSTHRDQTISAAIDEWQGVPYVWGGESKSGTDCSGFVGSMHRVAGVDIPRTTAEMAICHQGRRVKDELTWGDTLVFPGHCAFYVGDGRTAETVGGSGGGSVSHASIWSRSTVIVRRFLP